MSTWPRCARRRLDATTPARITRSFLTNSGTEAVEGALKVAHRATGRPKFVSTHGAFHGRTIGALAVNGSEKHRAPYVSMLRESVQIPFSDLDAARVAVDDATAAIIVEPIQGEGGVRVPFDGYLAGLREICDAAGALLICDEVQTGIGRTGTLFAYEQTGIEPDVMTLAKGLGGGVPIGCVLVKDHCDVLVPGDHGSTFGGNPLATAAGVHVLTRLLDGGVLDNARERGEQLEQRLRALEDSSTLAVGQRGAGLLRGLELGAEVALEVVNRAIPRGLIANPVRPDVVRFIPPLTVTAEEIDAAVDIIGKILDEIAAEQN